MSPKHEILLIEDERNICNFIVTTLKSNDYKVNYALNASSGLSLAAAGCPDLILLDLGLPDMDGIDVIRNIRNWSNVPIIVISARTQEKEKVEALDAGADDYITKPFGTSELMARIRTALRRSTINNNMLLPTQNQYVAKDLVIDYEKHIITIAGNIVHFTQIEYKILTYLAQNAGKVITYDSLISHVWGPFADSNNRILRVNMANIRRKLESNPADPQYIFTEIGIGYRMIDNENL
ncbi:MAG: response regulator transcription factor [Lachnospiraceae bacterium]|jgi:two-component system KDP operon response regulator KdpE|nr:response regulator transcription factor [Lachnospiraceae bacterium]